MRLKGSIALRISNLLLHAALESSDQSRGGWNVGTKTLERASWSERKARVGFFWRTIQPVGNTEHEQTSPKRNVGEGPVWR